MNRIDEARYIDRVYKAEKELEEIITPLPVPDNFKELLLRLALESFKIGFKEALKDRRDAYGS